MSLYVPNMSLNSKSVHRYLQCSAGDSCSHPHIRTHMGHMRTHMGHIRTHMGHIKTHIGHIRTHMGHILGRIWDI